MSNIVPGITLTELCFPDCTQKTIRAWGQVNFGYGQNYTTGGLVMGLVAFADARTVDFNGFLRCVVYGEDPISAAVGTYSYHYSPVNDKLQLLLNGTELANGAVIPDAVLNDVVLFEATWDRTTVRG